MRRNEAKNCFFNYDWIGYHTESRSIGFGYERLKYSIKLGKYKIEENGKIALEILTQ